MAQVGIGTMIVFIGTVLVASVAAAVVVKTGAQLQERSSQTGQEATDRISGTLTVSSIVGRRDTTADAGLRDLDLFLSLGPGASLVDLTTVRIQLLNGTLLKTFNYSQAASPGVLEFTAGEIRDADGGWTVAAPVLSPGDIVNATIALDTNTMELLPRDAVTLVLLPEGRNQVTSGFTTPPSYGARTTIEVR